MMREEVEEKAKRKELCEIDFVKGDPFSHSYLFHYLVNLLKSRDESRKLMDALDKPCVKSLNNS